MVSRVAIKKYCEFKEPDGTRCGNIAVAGTRYCKRKNHQPPPDAGPDEDNPGPKSPMDPVEPIVKVGKLAGAAKSIWEFVEKILGGAGGPLDAPSPEQFPDWPGFPGAVTPEQRKLISTIASAKNRAEREQHVQALVASLDEAQRFALGLAVLAAYGAASLAKAKRQPSDA